jgi:hypothetical protein
MHPRIFDESLAELSEPHTSSTYRKHMHLYQPASIS